MIEVISLSGSSKSGGELAGHFGYSDAFDTYGLSINGLIAVFVSWSAVGINNGVQVTIEHSNSLDFDDELEPIDGATMSSDVNSDSTTFQYGLIATAGRGRYFRAKFEMLEGSDCHWSFFFAHERGGSVLPPAQAPAFTV